MAFLTFSNFFCPNFCNPRNYSPPPLLISKRNRIQLKSTLTCHLCATETLTLDSSALDVSVAVSEDELWATACLRVRSFNNFPESYGIDDHKKYLAEREFEALKERIAGKREGFRRVSCINATLPLSRTSIFSGDLSSECKFSEKGEERVVVGTLDLNQCLRLPDEIIGKRPEGIGADSSRAYLSNVCVAKELHRNGVAYLLVAKSKKIALEWDITDLYVHVAVDNEPARKLYIKSGFVYENDEPAWQARFLDRPRRFLLWTDLSVTSNLTPCLQYLDWPYCGEFYFRRHWEAISSWKNLKGIDLGYYIGNDLLKAWLPCSFAYYFKNLRSLRLVGRRFGVEEVSEIIKTLFPQLEYFSLQDSSLTMDAVSLVVSEVVGTNNINNIHQVGIQTLDLRHCAFISSHFGCRDSVKQRLVEGEIHEKAAAAIKTFTL